MAWNAGLSLPKASAEVSARGPSSAENTASVTTGLPAFEPGTEVVTVTGISSSVKDVYKRQVLHEYLPKLHLP